MKLSYITLALKAFAILLLGCCLAVDAQEPSSQCVTPDRIASSRQKLVDMYDRYQGHLTEWNEVSSSRLKSLKLLAECDKQSTRLGDLASALTMNETDCNKIIRQHNSLALQENSLKGMMETEQTVIALITQSIKQGELRVCR